MSEFEIVLRGKTVSRDEAVRQLSKVGGGRVTVRAPAEDGAARREISVYARHHAHGAVADPEVNWASGTAQAAGARAFTELVTFAAGLAEDASQ